MGSSKDASCRAFFIGVQMPCAHALPERAEGGQRRGEPLQNVLRERAELAGVGLDFVKDGRLDVCNDGPVEIVEKTAFNNFCRQGHAPGRVGLTGVFVPEHAGTVHLWACLSISSSSTGSSLSFQRSKYAPEKMSLSRLADDGHGASRYAYKNSAGIGSRCKPQGFTAVSGRTDARRSSQNRIQAGSAPGPRPGAVRQSAPGADRPARFAVLKLPCCDTVVIPRWAAHRGFETPSCLTAADICRVRSHSHENVQPHPQGH